MTDKDLGITIHVPKRRGCEDSFFYCGDGDTFKIAESSSYILYCCGEVRIRSKKTGALIHDGYKTHDGCPEIKNDKQLEKLVGTEGMDDGRPYFYDNNNWFEVCQKLPDVDGGYYTDMGDKQYDYTEALNDLRDKTRKQIGRVDALINKHLEKVDIPQ